MSGMMPSSIANPICSFRDFGQSGQFVADYNGDVHLIPYQGIQVKWNRTPYSSTFTVTDESGNRYYFNEVETTVSEDLDNKEDVKDWITSWNLSRIVTSQNDTIRYYYTSNAPIVDVNTSHTIINSASWDVGTGWSIETVEEKTNSRRVTNYPRYLQRIEWNGGKLEFVAEENTDNKPPRLTEVKLYAENRYLKSTVLSYGTFDNGSTKLSSIDERMERRPSMSAISNTIRLITCLPVILSITTIGATSTAQAAARADIFRLTKYMGTSSRAPTVRRSFRKRRPIC